MAGDANQDPGRVLPTTNELLADLMQTGGLLDRHQAQAEELTAGREGISARRAELEAERTVAEQAVVDDFNAKAGRLGEEAVNLRDEVRRLKQRRGRAQGKATKLGRQLRELAADPNADRPTLLAYAGFAASRPDFTAEAVDKITELDETVRAADGQPFVLIQGYTLTFGRIEDGTTGLLVDTDEDTPPRGVVELPTADLSSSQRDGKNPYYGFVSRSFDNPREIAETYDAILNRSASEEDLIRSSAGYFGMSRFGLSPGALALPRPTGIRLAEAGEDLTLGDPRDEHEGFWDKDEILFTGETATDFLHRVVDARLVAIEKDMDVDKANAELGRFMGVTARLGIGIDVRQIPAHERFIQV